MRIVDQVFTLAEAAYLSGLAARTLRAQLAAGRLAGRRSGGTWLVELDEMRRYMREVSRHKKGAELSPDP